MSSVSLPRHPAVAYLFLVRRSYRKRFQSSRSEPGKEIRFMYAIMGVTGQIGRVVARTLLAARQPVRAVVRDAGKGQAWADRGCEIALATIEDAVSLAAAFQGTEGAFVLVPPNFDPRPEFPEAQAVGVALRSALEAARPARVVYLSTIRRSDERRG